MKKNRSPQFIATVMAAVIVLWMASGMLVGSDNKPQADVQEQEASLFRVHARHSRAELIARETRVNARTKPDREVVVRSELSGQVLSTGIERGAPVQEGDLIVSLEPRDRQARLAEAQATLQQLSLELDSAKKLADMGLKSKAELASAQSAVEAARASEAVALLDVERTKISAPFEGMLVERYVEKGDYLSPGTEVAKVSDMDPIVVTGALTEQEVAGTRPGMSASATLATGEKIEGIISYISPEADPQSRMYKVEMDSPNADGAIRAGIAAELIVPHEKTYAHFINPAYILLSDSGTIGMMLADEDGNTHFAPINIVNTTDTGIWVDGLPREIIIVTTGKDFIAAGQKVELIFGDEEEGAEGSAAQTPSDPTTGSTLATLK